MVVESRRLCQGVLSRNAPVFGRKLLAGGSLIG